MKKLASIMRILAAAGIFAIVTWVSLSMPCFSQDWRAIARDILKTYPGTVIAIEQLNDTTCWAVLAGNVSNQRALELAENIGYYIRNVTGCIKGATPTVRVFRGGRHLALARPSGMKYIAKWAPEDWDPSEFKGKYRP